MDDDLVITIGSETLSIDTITTGTYNVGDITLTSGSVQSYNGMSWTSISDLITDTIDLDNLTITTTAPVEFEDHMPSVAKVEDMCNDYPALQKAYENFKTIYAMVRQDWEGRQEDDKP